MQSARRALSIHFFWSTMAILSNNFLALLLAGLMAFANPVFAQSLPPIKIGFAVAQSGWMTAYDTPPLKGALLKINEINQNGGLLGRKIDVVTVDTKSEREEGAKAGESLIAKRVDLLVVSSDYDFGSPAALAARKTGTIVFSLGAGDPKMGPMGVGSNAFTPNLASQVEGISIAEWAWQKKGLHRVYILEDNSIEYSKSACAGFRAALTQLGGTSAIAGSDTFKNSDPSIASQITRLRAVSPAPDAVYLCTYNPGGASAVRQLRAGGIELPILSNVAMADGYWHAAVPNLSNFYAPTYMSTFGEDPRPAANTFIKAWKGRYGSAPESAYSILGYTLIEQWAAASSRAGTADSPAVIAQLEKFHDESFTVGPTSYSRALHIQVNRPLLMMGVQNGVSHTEDVWRNRITPSAQLLYRIAAKS